MKVQVTEFPAQRIRTGVGYSTDTGAQLATFFYERLAGLLREQGYSAQEVDAVLALFGLLVLENPILWSIDVGGVVINLLLLGYALPAVLETHYQDDQAKARLHSVVASAAERWARRISRSGVIDQKDIALISEALAVPLASAERWAAEQNGLELAQADLCQSLTQLGMNP